LSWAVSISEASPAGSALVVIGEKNLLAIVAAVSDRSSGRQ
jgi:hypothetical protein